MNSKETNTIAATALELEGLEELSNENLEEVRGGAKLDFGFGAGDGKISVEFLADRDSDDDGEGEDF